MAWPQPRTVWMVRPGRPEAVEGILALSGNALAFEPQDGAGLRVPVGRIRSARRHPGTPLLALRYADAEGRDTRTFFFFVRPPPLSSADQLRAERRPFLPSLRGLERTASIMSLRSAAREARAAIGEWVAAIRAAAGGAE